MVMPRLLNDKLSPWAARSVDPLCEDDQIISVNRRLLGQVCEQAVAGDLVLAAAGSKFQHVRIGLGDTARDNHAARVAHVEHITLGKLAIDLTNTNRKQGRPVADQSFRGTVIDRHRAVGLVAQRNPQLAGRNIQALSGGSNSVPTLSPRARRTSASGSSPEQITL